MSIVKKIFIISIFPDLFSAFLSTSIVGRAVKAGLVAFELMNPRDFAKDKHHKVDDRPYGGGPGMVMYATPIGEAIESALAKCTKARILLTSPRGRKLTNTKAETLMDPKEALIIVCGHYEGIDARLEKMFKTEKISIGNYTLSGGELPALVIADAVVRRLPGALGNAESIEEKRVAGRRAYTRPEVIVWKGKTFPVPKVLRSGNHARIETWRKRAK